LPLLIETRKKSLFRMLCAVPVYVLARGAAGFLSNCSVFGVSSYFADVEFRSGTTGTRIP